LVESLADKITRSAGQVSELYYRLVILVAPDGGGKTSALWSVHERTGAPIINVNLELAHRMLDLTARQRTLQCQRLLAEIVNTPPGDMTLLDNFELLFAVSLKQDPLRLLQGLSRNKTLVVAWSGAIDDKYLTYATPDHPEYKRYPHQDILVIQPEVSL